MRQDIKRNKHTYKLKKDFHYGKKSDHEKQGNLAWLQAKVAFNINSQLRIKTLRKFLKL